METRRQGDAVTGRKQSPCHRVSLRRVSLRRVSLIAASLFPASLSSPRPSSPRHRVPASPRPLGSYSAAGKNTDLLIAASFPTTAKRMFFMYLFATLRMSAGVTDRTPFRNSNEFLHPPPISS